VPVAIGVHWLMPRGWLISGALSRRVCARCDARQERFGAAGESPAGGDAGKSATYIPVGERAQTVYLIDIGCRECHGQILWFLRLFLYARVRRLTREYARLLQAQVNSSIFAK